MKDIILDTETTGLDVAKKHRIIEIGCVEMISGRRTGRVFHKYINPQRAVSEEALAVHGLNDAFLRKHNPFNDIADEFLSWIEGGRLVIHNAQFDLAFLNAELGLCHLPPLDDFEVIDTLALAREKFPNQSNRLDALCQRFGVDNSQRTQHSALLDASLLAEVYIALTQGQQSGFDFSKQSEKSVREAQKTDDAFHKNDGKKANEDSPLAPQGENLPVNQAYPNRLSIEEDKAHQKFVEKRIGKNALWHQFLDINKI